MYESKDFIDDHEVADDHLEVDHEVADDESRDTLENQVA